MRVLLTNDDGIDAIGIAELAAAFNAVADVTVVAPRDHHSGCGHKTTVDRPLAVEEIRSGWFSVDGSPADCVRIGITHLVSGCDWLLSGVNDGANLGVDVYMSGTVAAAREGALMGVNSAAFSQYRTRDRSPDWPQIAQAALAVWKALPTPAGGGRPFWNVNFPNQKLVPHLPETVDAPLDRHPLPIEYRKVETGYLYSGNYQARSRDSDSDVDVCFRGSISRTRIEA